MIRTVRSCFTLLFSVFSMFARAEDFTNAIDDYLQKCVEAEKIKCGIVVGLVDEHGTRDEARWNLI